MYNKIKSIKKFVRREIFRDPFLLAIKEWFSVDGDRNLRYDYPLDSNSIVWDLGGYRGDFTHCIRKKYGCKVYLFEPVPSFYNYCVERFRDDDLVACFPYGLSNHSGKLMISENADASSFENIASDGITINAKVESIIETFTKFQDNQIDLLKINIEGGEYDVLNALLDAGMMYRIRFLQVQFHNFVPGADKKRLNIRRGLAKSHHEMWNFPFVWESWGLK